MEYALKVDPDGRGIVLCDAKTGDIIDGQIECRVVTDLFAQKVEVLLRFHNLPIFKG